MVIGYTSLIQNATRCAGIPYRNCHKLNEAGMAGAAPKVDSKYQDHARAVACPRSVILALRASVLESFTSGPHGGAEVYGILFGTHGGNEVRISAFQVIDFQSAMAGATPLSEYDRKSFRAALEAAAGRSDPKAHEPVGWFRAHPNSELRLTPRDLEIAAEFFPSAHQVAMIFRPSESVPNLVRFFYRESEGILTAESPFCEFNLPPALDAAPVAEVPVAQERPAVAATPNRIQAPVPPPAPQPETATEDTDALMELPEPPGAPRRRIHLKWPLMLAAAIGLVLAWYWMTQASERLALHVIDAGGQLRILWDPVRDGETGNLEIIDGPTRYSIAIDADQLRNGTLTYKRHTQKVKVSMWASRPGAGTLVESIDFLAKNTAPAEPAPPPTGSASREGSRTLEAQKPPELVLPVPVILPRPAARPKFSAPIASQPGPSHQAPNLAPPPVVTASAPASVPSQVETLAPPVEKPAPPAVQPPAAVPEKAAAVKPVITPAPPRAAPVPATPVSGRIIWIGRLQKNEELWINGKACSTGTIVGELPGKPVKFSVSPGNLSSDGIVLFTANPEYANNVTESPGAQNGWNKTTYTWNPKYANDVTVKEAPAAQNWNRVVLHSKNPKISVVVIDWVLVN
jgi:hypothetical protein